MRWESGKVIGNIARQFKNELHEVLEPLISNTEHESTVVRWSAAVALGEILKLKTDLNKDLVYELERILEKEEKKSIKKIYEAAIKQIK